MLPPIGKDSKAPGSISPSKILLTPMGSASNPGLVTDSDGVPSNGTLRSLRHTGRVNTTEISQKVGLDDIPTQRKELPKIGREKEIGQMEVYRGSTNAAGVPILELVRKMEYEGVISRDDRLALNEALYNPDKREAVIQAVRNVELGMNPRFSVKRLKALIHGNAAGAPRHRSKTANDSLSGSRNDMAEQLAEALADVFMDNENKSRCENSRVTSSPSRKNVSNDPCRLVLSPDKRVKKATKEPVPVAPEASVESQDTINALQSVLGSAPTYADICSRSNLTEKIAANLKRYFNRVKVKKSRPRPLVVIVGGGSFNPLTRMHLRTFFVAKQFIEKQLRAEVVGALLSPAHASLVRLRYRTCASEVIPTAHRLAIAQLCVQGSRWLSVDPWEITRRCAMDYLSQLDHVQSVLSSHFPNVNIKLFYLSKPNFVPKLSIEGMKKNGFSCICVCRAPESDYLRSSLGSRANGVVYVAEDTAILDASMDQVSAKKVRDKLKAGKDVEDLVGHAINEYILHHRIAQKVFKTENVCFSACLFSDICSAVDAKNRRVE